MLLLSLHLSHKTLQVALLHCACGVLDRHRTLSTGFNLRLYRRCVNCLQEVAQHVPADICNLYLKARDRVREKEQVEEHAKEMQCLEERLRKELADQIAPVRRLIVDTVLTTSCPRCRAAFVDFTGCMALTCSRPGCSCGFCAICLKDCDRDAHAHIARCTYMTVGRGNVFASEDNIKQMQNAWRTAKIKEVSCTSHTAADPTVLCTFHHTALQQS